MKTIEDGVRSLLLALDFSQTSNRAFDAAVRMARVFGAHLHLLHVNEEERFFLGHDSSELAHFLNDVARRRAEWMSAYEARARALGIEASALLRDGDPAQTILDVADELGAGILVLGTQGAQGLTTLLLGSVAKRVLRRAERPVLMVSRLAGVAPADAGGTFESIVYPTDLSQASRAGVAVARLLANRTGASIVLAHVIRMPRVIPSLAGEAPILWPRAAEAPLELSRQAEMEELRETMDDARIHSVVSVDDDPARSICELAGQAGHDLIVIPRHSRHGVASAVFGHTAETVAKMAPVPVLLFTPRLA